MPRITPVRTKDQVEEQYYGVFDAIAESRGEVRGPFSLLMHSPELAGRAAHLGAYIRFEGALDNATMETAIISAAREFNCGYEWGAHVAMARQAGVPETTIAAIRDRRNGDLPDDVRLVVDFAQRLVREKGRIDETTLKAMETRLGTKALVEMVATVGYYGMIGTVLNAFAQEPAATHDPLPL